MLNKKQLKKLNEIFHRDIKPVFEKNPEAVDELMRKIEEYQSHKKEHLETEE